MADQNGEKTQDATPHRRQKAREEGQVARSQDLGSAAILVGALGVLLTMGSPLVAFFSHYTEQQLSGAAWMRIDIDLLMVHWHDTLGDLTAAMLPILAAIMVVAILSNLLQVGFMFLPNKMAPDFSRISPKKGLSRLFSSQSAMRVLFGLFKITIIAVVAFVSLYSERQTILELVGLTALQIGVYIIDIVLWTSMKIGIALLILAIFDFLYQKWKHEQDMKMTNQEVREEMKNLQGDPQIIARRRQVQRQLALNRLSSAVPEADVVVTNPTELAIAIKYTPEEMAAPVVVAKGAGVIAQRIRKLALENSVPIVENKPLARSLYKEVDVNHPIPDESYAAVAEVLAYVYQLKGKPIPKPLDRAA